MLYSFIRFEHGVPNSWNRGQTATRILHVVCTLGLLLTGLAVASSSVLANAEQVEAGRRVYEEGVLPDGGLLRAMRPEGFMQEGKHAACVVCHRRSGMGSVEGNAENAVLVPPVAGSVLFAPSRYAAIPLDPLHHYLPNAAWERVLTRSAYDAESVANALRQGKDPDGRQLVAPMPVYNLDDKAMAALMAYLEQLSKQPDPGLEQDALHLATVISADADPEYAYSVLSVLREWSDYARVSGGVPWRLHEWRLHGPADTWTAQLEKHYQKRPVFALLSGIGTTEWEPVHRYCEKYRIPCVLPSLEMTPETGGDWYSIYYSPGVDLEARILARYLNTGNVGIEKGGRVVQLYSSTSGHRATGVLTEHLGREEVAVSKRRFRTTSPRSVLRGITDADVMMLWLRPDEIAQLVEVSPQGPPAAVVYVSALLADTHVLDLPAAWKQRVRFVSLFDDLSLQGEIARHRLDVWLENAGLETTFHRRLQADAYAAAQLFYDAIGAISKQEVRRPPVHLNREHVVETLEKLVDKYSDSTSLVEIESHVAWYGRMSLGPRQRIAVRGGTILSYLSPDPGSYRLKAVSKRIVP